MNAFQLDIARMELRGVLINRSRLPMLYMQAEEKTEELTRKIQESCGYPCNPGSPKQMGAWLKVKSTAKAVLQRMKDDERAKWLLEYRQWSKAQSTYYGPYIRYMDDKGVLRCNLHLTTPGILTRGKDDSRNGTISGRLSSSKPNLQQVPRGSESYRVMELFIARPGYLLCVLDYSQAELRVAAHYSQDQLLKEILLSGVDMHSRVAEEMGVPRHIAKNINFSAWYGIGAQTFSRNYFVGLSEARVWLTKYHKMFPGIRRLYNACEHHGVEKGYIKVYTGRMRRYNCLQSPAYKASNNLIQMTVAEMIRRAIMRTRREVPEARQVLMVHDSTWYEIPEHGALETVRKLLAIMQDQPFVLPMIVDAKMGRGFADAKDLPRDPIGIPPDTLARITDYDRVFNVAG
jgi:DNA polymerase-1